MTWVRVGIDGSGTSGRALEWAAGLARAVDATLEVASVLGPRSHVLAEAPDLPPDPDLEESVRSHQADAVAEHVSAADGLDVRHRLLHGHPGQQLCSAEPTPDLLVVGTRGVGGFAGLIVGSTAHTVVEYAPCTAVIVPHELGPREDPGRYVVGVDGSAASREALAWAITQATRTGAALEVVVAWRAADSSRPAILGRTGVATTEEATARLADRIGADAGRTASDAGVTVTTTVEHGKPHDVLLDRTDGANLLVLGAPGGDGPRHLGSVAHRTLKSATVPIAVVR